jgi:hypothetical protein
MPGCLCAATRCDLDQRAIAQLVDSGDLRVFVEPLSGRLLRRLRHSNLGGQKSSHAKRTPANFINGRAHQSPGTRILTETRPGFMQASI